MHYLPERIFTNSRLVHKYFSSDVIKGVIAVLTIITVNILLRDAIKLAEADRAKVLSPQHPSQIASPQPVTPVDLNLHKLLSKYGQAPEPIQAAIVAPI